MTGAKFHLHSYRAIILQKEKMMTKKNFIFPALVFLLSLTRFVIANDENDSDTPQTSLLRQNSQKNDINSLDYIVCEPFLGSDLSLVQLTSAEIQIYRDIALDYVSDDISNTEMMYCPHPYQLYHKPVDGELTYILQPTLNELSMIAPCIPNITQIQSCDDIIQISRFFKFYCDYMHSFYLSSHEVMTYWVLQHFLEVQSQSALLLDFVRPKQYCSYVYSRISNEIRTAIYNKHWNLAVCQFHQFKNSNLLTHNYQPIWMPCAYDANLGTLVPSFAFTYSVTHDWGSWFPQHNDISQAVLYFLKLIWKTPISFSLKAYANDIEFENAIKHYAPELATVIDEKQAEDLTWRSSDSSAKSQKIAPDSPDGKDDIISSPTSPF